MATVTDKRNLKNTAVDFYSSSNTLNKKNGLQEIRKEALDAFSTMEFPTRKDEEYKYTNIVSHLNKGQFSFNVPDGVMKDEYLKDSIINSAWHRIVFVNGIYRPEFSSLEKLNKGIHVSEINEASSTSFHKNYGKIADFYTDVFVALNTATALSGVYIHVNENVSEAEPIHIINIVSTTHDFVAQPRVLVVAEKSSNINIVESYRSFNNSASVFINNISEVFVCEQAKVEYNILQLQDNTVIQHHTATVNQCKESHCTVNTFTFSGKLVRNNLTLQLNGERIESHLNGLSIAKEGMLVDNHTLVDHRIPNCYSNELYKGIAEGNSTVVFNGKIYVRKDAQKTNAFQSNKNILLSDDASVNTKPQLEIYADDVKCSHGSSTGKLDPDAMFYFRARGIGEEAAKKLLINAFAGEVIERVGSEEVKSYAAKILEEKLG